MEEIKFKAEGDDSFLVFGSAKKSSNHTSSTYLDHRFSIQDRIKTALSTFNSNYRTEIQVQFWAATTEDGRRLLTTFDQPFAYHCRSDEKWMKYMTDCPNKKFVAEGEEDLNLTDDGPVSRVFRTQFPEASPDLSIYSVKEYPERDLALGCGFQATLVLPVFEPTLQLRVCVGVIEILFTKYIDIVLYHYIDWARRMLQKAGLDTVNPKQLRIHIEKVHLVLVKEELKGAMAQVLETHGLPLVCFWARCEHMSSNSYDVNCRGELPISIPEMLVFDHNNGSSNDYLSSSFSQSIRVGKGHVGMAFHTDKPCFCRDVTQLSIIDYPLAHFARLSKFTGRFAVCLQSIATGFRGYVLEFFLPPDKSNSGDLRNFLSSILMMLKQHLKFFEVVTGDIGNDLFTEIGYLNEPNVEASIANGKNAICAEEDNTSFTYNTISTSSGHETTNSSTEFTSLHTISSLNTFTDYETISLSGDFTSIKKKAEDSAWSLRSRSIECTMNSTQRRLNNYTGPSGNKSYLDPSPSKINEPVDSETGSSGRVMSASQYQVPTMKESRGDSSLSNAPRSEGSTTVARTIPPYTMVDVEMVTNRK